MDTVRSSHSRAGPCLAIICGRLSLSTQGLEVEQEEEKISNVLLKKIDTLQREREQIMRTVEEEEEYITNTLQKKLDQVYFRL